MDFLVRATLQETLEVLAERPEARPICGGTDVMVAINHDLDRPSALLDLSHLEELATLDLVDGCVRLGAGVSYARVIEELPDALPGLAAAARTVGSPLIRTRGTVGGNLGAGSPAGDSHPPLLVSGATVIAASSARGERRIPVEAFYVGVKRTALEPDELVVAIEIPVADGPQRFAKVGPRNAMTIAVCSLAIALAPGQGRVRAAIGSAAPTPRRAPEAERYLEDALAGRWEREGPLLPAVRARFGELVAAAASAIDDVRGTAAYRRHALGVLAGRTLDWAWDDHQAMLGRAA
jgi:CO/xanthine dehydrogenase FAD-binding subunit